MKTAALLLLLAACSPPQPVGTHEIEAPVWADDALDVITLEWSDRIVELDELPEIHWFAGECLEYDVDTGDLGADGCWKGFTWIGNNGGPSEIHMTLGSGDQDAKEILAHELLHWTLEVLDEDSDADHGRLEYWSQLGEVVGAL